MARDIVRALPARNLAIVNGHGGNRGVLDNLIHELRGDFALNACVVHPFDLSKVATGATSPDVHGGKSETSVMLALAPQPGAHGGDRARRRAGRQRSHRGIDLRSRRELSVAYR